MAKKIPAPRPNPDHVQVALRKGDFATAGELAHSLYKSDPSPGYLNLLRTTLLTSAKHHAEQDRAQSVERLLAELTAVSYTGPVATLEFAKIHARAGNTRKAQELAASLNDPAALIAVQNELADRALRKRVKDGLPPELHAGYEAILTGFTKYESGDDDGAKTALETIGLRSPFVEWKLLLRGLTAYTAGDDARAIENFSRLNADRLPYRFAAPIRTQIDARFRKAQFPDVASQLDTQFRGLAGPGMALSDALRELRSNMARKRKVSEQFPRLEAVLRQLRTQSPSLEPLLARAMYREIAHHGAQDDLQRYKKLFGAPADDPAFHRIEAMGFEKSGMMPEANRHWGAYEAWLATNPTGWPVEVAKRARAIILNQMAENAMTDVDMPDELADAFSMLFGRRGGPLPLSAAPKKTLDPLPLLNKAIELAPDWDAPAKELVARLLDDDKLDEADRVVRRLLEANPTAVEVIPMLAEALAKAGRATEALDYRLKALAANPLDQMLRITAACAYLGQARRQMIGGELPAALATLESGAELCREFGPAVFLSLQSTIARKQKRIDDADHLQAEAIATPHRRLAALLSLAADAGLAKLPPKQKKPLDDALSAAWKAPALPLEAQYMYAVWHQYASEGVDYRGHKTQVSKIHTLMVASVTADAPEKDFEALISGTVVRQDWKLALKLAPKLQSRFSKNPVFPMMFAQAEIGKAGNGRVPYHRVQTLLLLARRLAEASQDPRHKSLTEVIAEMEKTVDGPNEFLRNFF